MVDDNNFFGTIRFRFLLVVLASMVMLLSLVFSGQAAVFEGNATINWTGNSTYATQFNFTNQGSNTSTGHVKFDNLTSWDTIFEPVSDADTVKNLFLGFLSPDHNDFVANFINVPNSTFSDPFHNDYYGKWPSANFRTGDVVGFWVNDSTNTSYFGALYVLTVNVGVNVTFAYKYSNESGNNSFGGTLTGCKLHTDPVNCVNDHENNCDWFGSCEARRDEYDIGFSAAECEMLGEFACRGLNTSICLWDNTIGTQGQCTRQSGWEPKLGFNCTGIVNISFCTNQTFTEGSNLCTWNGSNICVANSSKTFADIPQPRSWQCDADTIVDNESACDELADVFFLPCGFNNVTNRCEFTFFDFGKAANFEDATDEKTCNTLGGLWRSEVTFDPLTSQVSTEAWCEPNIAIKSFDDIGGGGKGHGGGTQLSSCTRECYACEFQANGSLWGTQGEMQTSCQDSGAGCFFVNDTDAFNGQGWCNPAFAAGEDNCESSCGACNFHPNPQAGCQNSSAGCKWENQSQSCLESSSKGCGQECFQCFNSSTCDGSPAQGGCSWDATNYFCSPKGGSFEICFDAIDNDNNGKTDCEDFKCANDPFCGGGAGVGGSCFSNDVYTHGNEISAQYNCTNVTGCFWLTDDFNFSYCGPESELCWQNDTMSTVKAACNAFTDSSGSQVCNFITDNRCEHNLTQENTCFNLTNSGNRTLCGNTSTTGAPGCMWDTEFSFCQFAPWVKCEDNSTVQVNESVCHNAGCYWQGGNFGSNFEGHHFANCVSPCFNTSINTQAGCSAANGSAFGIGTCEFRAGFCEPKHIMGGDRGCFSNDGDVAACSANSNCRWDIAPFGGMLTHPNGSGNFSEILFSSETWIGMGLQRPRMHQGNTSNESVYSLNSTTAGNYTWLLMSGDNSLLHPQNLTRVYCNQTVVMEYNWTNQTCITGGCDNYEITTCNGKVLHYGFNATNENVELLWEVSIKDLAFAGNVTNTSNISTIKIDGNMSEMQVEPATANDGTNASRALTSAGFCNDGLMNTYFQDMDSDAPLGIAGDVTDDGGTNFSDFTGLGVKKTPSAYMYGMPVSDLNGTMLCNGVSIRQNTDQGTGNATAKYYLYLDTNGNDADGCNATNNATVKGFEYLFKYVTEQGASGRLKETLLAQNCVSGDWVASNVPLKANKQKSCGFVGGPIIGVDTDSLNSKEDVNASKAWRAYAASADKWGNATNVNDTVGPGTGDFKGIDVELVDCSSTADKDNSICSSFKQFGFFPGEFGPACADNQDNDNDGLVDCQDFDCKFDPFFCSASEHYVAFGSVDANDKSSPNIVWHKVNNKLPTALTVIFDANEPSNGSLRYYYNDSTCATLNNTYLDEALSTGDTHDDYRPHHIVDITGLTANTTYFYKLDSCDPSGNCALSKCSNATTSATHTNITFKLDIPVGWTVDIPSINLTNYSAVYSLKVSTEHLDDINITVNESNSSRAIKLIGVDIFEKQTLNLSLFKTGSSFGGMDANQYSAFKQKTGLKKTEVEIPITGTDNDIQHCDDAGANCKDVSDNVNCTYVSGKTTCSVPDAVGLGFSTYKSVTSSSSTSTSSSSGSSGGGGGGGSALPVETEDEEDVDEVDDEEEEEADGDEAAAAEIAEEAEAAAEAAAAPSEAEESTGFFGAGLPMKKFVGWFKKAAVENSWVLVTIVVIGLAVALGVFIFHKVRKDDL